MLNWLWFLLAAFFEIAGCYAFWYWLRMEQSPLWLIPGVLCLILFALVLTRIDAAFAGRAYAAYGGIYIISSLVWLNLVERSSPILTDYLGMLLCLTGAAVILFGPRLLAN
ncbi:MAG: YnfA family protein [Gammaproteobacteria bacterium]